MHSLRKHLPIAAVAGSLAVLAVAAVPAFAHNGSRAAALGAVRMHSPATTSPNFAGWLFGKTGSAKSTVEYKAPAITCTSATQGVAPSNVVLSGPSTKPVEQAAGLLVACDGGTKVYIPYVEVNSGESNLMNTVKAGDVIKLTVSASTTKVSATFADLTSPRKFSKTITGPGSAALQEQDGDGRVALSGSPLSIVKFKTISWNHGAINSKPLGSVKPNKKINMQTGSTLEIQTGALTPTGSTANAFKTVWKHS